MPKKNLLALKINEISAVDRPAQEGARAVIMKRVHLDGIDEVDDKKKKPKKGEPGYKEKGWVEDNQGVLLEPAEGHSHLLPLGVWSGTTSYTVTEGDDSSHEHPFQLLQDGTFEIGLASGHTHEIDPEKLTVGIQRFMAVKNEPLPESLTEAIMKATDLKEATTMPGTKTNEDLVKDLESSTNTNADLTAQLDKANKLAELSDVQKAHYSTLEDTAKDEFLAKSSDEREAVMKNLEDADPVVFTTEKGMKIRKSEGPTVLALAKENEDMAKGLAKSEALRVEGDLRKQVAADFSHLAGSEDTHVALLKAVQTIADEEVRKNVLETLKAKDAGIAKAFINSGESYSADPQEGSAEAELDDLAKRRATEKGIDFSKAYTEVLSTPEGTALYKRMDNERSAAPLQ